MGDSKRPVQALLASQRTRRSRGRQHALAMRATHDEESDPLLLLQQRAGNQAVNAIVRQFAAGGPVPPSVFRSTLIQRCGPTPCNCSTEERARYAETQATTIHRVHAGPDGRKQFDCPEFAGDTKLEACLNDEDRLAPKSKGDTVTKVQKALLRDGMDLGSLGADGNYGPATGRAVKAFKAKYSLGFEQFPDVGPGTMKKLDELCTPGPAPKPPSPKPPAPTSCFDRIDWDDFFAESDETCRLSQSGIDAACALAPNSPFNLGPDLCPKAPLEERVEDCVATAGFDKLVQECGIPSQPPGKAEIRKRYREFLKKKPTP